VQPPRFAGGEPPEGGTQNFCSPAYDYSIIKRLNEKADYYEFNFKSEILYFSQFVTIRFY